MAWNFLGFGSKVKPRSEDDDDEDYYNAIERNNINDRHYEAVRLMIENGKGTESSIRGLNDLALRWCAETGNCRILKLLVENGIDIHWKNEEALIVGACEGHYEIVKLLIELGAYVNAQNGLALRCSTHNGHHNISKLLISKGASKF